MHERVPREFLSGSAEELAPALIGRRLVRVLDDGTRLSGIIVETEAYLGVKDRAAHSFGGRRTPRNESMYARAGTAYVYFTYGMHHCVNVVCGEVGEPVAVLIRGLEPDEGRERMALHRGLAGGAEHRPGALCGGPAKTCQAMAITRALDGADLVEGSLLFIEAGRGVGAAALARGPRIGVDYAGAWARRRLRWALSGNPHVSVPMRGAGSIRARSGRRTARG